MLIEECLGKDDAEALFQASVISSLITEKRAAYPSVWSSVKDALGLGWKGLSKIPRMALWTAGLGAGLGVLGATGYDVIKDTVSNADPKEKHNYELESIYRGKKRELSDSKWIAKAIEKRDNLKRNYKKMSLKEYEAAYQDLIKTLDERKA